MRALSCVSNDGSKMVAVPPGAVFSGNNSGGEQCQDNRKCADKKGVGPTPPGTYDMVQSAKYGGSWWLKEGFATRQLCTKLGIGRCEFYLHRGGRSNGCITVDEFDPAGADSFGQINNLLKSESKNTMRVSP
jgi:Protein of unknown function (DUF2778)